MQALEGNEKLCMCAGFAVGIVAMLPILLKQRGGKKSAENKKTG